MHGRRSTICSDRLHLQHARVGGRTKQILDDLAALSDKLTVEELNLVLDPEQAAAYGIDRAPAIALVGTRDSGIRFYGAPVGYEFRSLVDAILVVSTGGAGLSDESRALVVAVDRPLQIQVFVTPTCSHCPKAVSLAHRMAFANPHIRAIAVQATEFPDLVHRYRVNGVPKTVVDDRIEILGALPEAAFVRQALSGLANRTEAVEPGSKPVC